MMSSAKLGLNPQQVSSLKQILNQATELEKNWDLQKDSRSEKISNLALLFKKLGSEDHEILQKISRYHTHLTSDLKLRQLLNFIVPVERLLGQGLADHEFMVTNQDTPSSLDSRISSAARTSVVTSSRPAQDLPLLEVYLDHWRSAFNVGSAFRTADALGVQKIHLGGYTATPEQDIVQKTSLGSEKHIPWIHHEKTIDALKKLKSEGYRLIALETSPQAKMLSQTFEKQKSIFIFGNERFGLDPEVLNLCDELRAIPMEGFKNSLNAAVCMALTCYEWKRQWKSN